MQNTDTISVKLLREFVERIERLEEEKDRVSQDLKEVYAEAKSRGFDTKVLRIIVKERKMDSKARDEQDMIWELLDVYKRALGMEADNE